MFQFKITDKLFCRNNCITERMNFKNKMTIGMLVFATCVPTQAREIANAATETEPTIENIDEIPDFVFEEDIISDTISAIPEEFSDRLDYLLHMWAVENAAATEYSSTDNHPTALPDSVYRNRLAVLPCVMEMPYNSYVKSFIDLYTVQKRQHVKVMLGMGKYYFPIFEEILAANDMPLELKYLPVIESALNSSAFSRMGAAGLWQFMVATGRMYGLEINSLVDERMDPIKSTHAAVRYLKDLYAIYSDWNLVIAAYNCGPGNVRKAISRSDGKRDYWAIYPHLPRETRSYVPIFIAATYTMEYASEHGLFPAIVDVPIISDTILLNESIHFEQIAAIINIPLDQLKRLNPQYRRSIIPGAHKPYSLCLPAHYLSPFIEKYDEITQYRADELVNNRRKEIEAARQLPSGASGKVIYHTVRSGQTLGGIAQTYGVSVSKLRQWNNINGSFIKAGQKLKIMK